MASVFDELESKYGANTGTVVAPTLFDELDAKYGRTSEPDTSLFDELETKYGSLIATPQSGSIFDELEAKYGSREKPVPTIPSPAVAPPPGIKEVKPGRFVNTAPTGLEAAGRGAIRTAIPSIAGLGGAIAGGAALGALAGSPTGPGAIVTGLIGGLAGGIAAFFGAHKLQEYGIGKLVGEDALAQYNAQREVDIATHPYASLAGELAPQAIITPFNIRNLAKAATFIKMAKASGVEGTKNLVKTEAGRDLAQSFANVVFGTGTQAGFSAYDAIQTGNPDPIRIGMQVMAGAFLTGRSPLSKRLNSTKEGRDVAQEIKDALAAKGEKEYAVQEGGQEQVPKPVGETVQPIAGEPVLPDQGIPREAAQTKAGPIVTEPPIALRQLAVKIASGAKDFTPEELQLQQNFPQELEAILAGTRIQKPAQESATVKTQPATQEVVDSIKQQWRSELDAIPARNTKQRRELEAIFREKAISLDPLEREASKQFFEKPISAQEAQAPETITPPAAEAVTRQAVERTVETPITKGGATISEAKPISTIDAIELGRPVQPPEGATFIRTFDSQNRFSVTPTKDLDVLAGTGVVRAEFGVKGQKGEFVPLPEQPTELLPKPIAKMSIPELRAELKRAGLPTNGGGAVLRERLSNATFESSLEDAARSGKITPETHKAWSYVKNVLGPKLGLDIDIKFRDEIALLYPNIPKHINDMKRGLVPDAIIQESIRTGRAVQIFGANPNVVGTHGAGKPGRINIEAFLGGNERTAIHEIAEHWYKTRGIPKGEKRNAHELADEYVNEFFRNPPDDYQGYVPSDVPVAATGSSILGNIPTSGTGIRREGTFQSQILPTDSYTGKAREASAKMDANDLAVEEHFRPTWDRVRNFISSAIRDVPQPNMRKIKGTMWQKPVADAFDQIRGAGPKAGLRMDEARRSVYDILGRDIDVRELDRRRMAKNVIEATEAQLERGEVRLNVKNLTVDQARDYLAMQDKLLGPERAAKLDAADKAVQSVFDDALSRLRDNGLLTEESYSAIKAKHKAYSPMYFIQHIDPVAEGFGAGGRIVKVPDSGIEHLGRGSDSALVSNWEYLANQVLLRTESRIAKNNANIELAKMASDANNPLGAKLVPMEEGKTPLVPSGYEEIPYMDKGIRKGVMLPADVAKYWATTDPVINSKAAKVMGWISGANVVRALATGYSPEFAFRNAFMDSAYTWFRNEEYSAFMPMAMAQRTKDLFSVMGDAWRNGPKTRAFIREGGSMDFLSSQGRIHPSGETKMHPALTKLEQVLSKLNTWSEMVGRLATRERAIENGSTPQDATLIARNVIDFSKGGWLTKAIDRMGVPYLNAAVRATDGLFQSAANNFPLFALKAGQLMVAASGLVYWGWKTSPKTMESISEREKEGYWIVPLGDLYVTDAAGKPKYLYFRIRKDQAGRAVAATAETFTERAMGRQVDGTRIMMGMFDMSPVDPKGMMPPIVAAMSSYAANKNFWTNEDIWKGVPVSPHLESYMQTPEYLKSGAEALSRAGIEISPERARQAGLRLFPVNAWTAMMMGGVNAMIPSDDPPVRKAIAERVLSYPGVRTVLGSTREMNMSPQEIATAKRLKISLKRPDGSLRASNAIRQDLERETVELNDRRKVLKDALAVLLARVRTKQGTYEDAIKWIRTIENPKDRDFLRKRLHDTVRVRISPETGD